MKLTTHTSGYNLIDQSITYSILYIVCDILEMCLTHSLFVITGEDKAAIISLVLILIIIIILFVVSYCKW